MFIEGSAQISLHFIIIILAVKWVAMITSIAYIYVFLIPFKGQEVPGKIPNVGKSMEASRTGNVLIGTNGKQLQLVFVAYFFAYLKRC